MDHPLVLWLLCDGKPGHENQSLGLAEAVCRRVPGEIHRISVDAGGIIGRVKASMASAASLPRPHLILAAGHATHLSLLFLARRYRAKSIVLMRPSLPLSWFDLCIAPQHDFPNGCHRENVILTRGALNRVTPGTLEKSGKLILIGGPSKTHGWDGTALLDMLAAITGDGAGWELTDSRRTPVGFLDSLREKLPNIRAISHTQTPPNWVPEKLRQAEEVWVTDDSVSMIYEALTSGAKVGLLATPRPTGFSRVLGGIDGLVEDRYLTTFADWLKTRHLAAPPQALREADRCAETTLRIAFI
ncbi:MAG: mitochondrial fission ELM1 family protein [Luteolibacter sp.]